MKLKKQTMNNKEKLPVKDDLFGRLLNRQLFPWPNESSSTINNKIRKSAKNEAKSTIEALSRNLKLSPRSVLDKVLPRATSWQFPELLDHIMLKRAYRLGNFLNLSLEKKTVFLNA